MLLVLLVAMLVGSLLMLALGAEMLVRGSAFLARRMGVSSFFIGLTIVGFGTSTPELGTGVTAALRGVDDINVGNVIGSNIVNIALILGIGSLIAPTPVKLHQVRSEIWIVIILSFIPYLALLQGGVISRPMGLLLLLAIVLYLIRAFVQSRRDHALNEEALERELAHELGLDRGGWLATPLGSTLSVIAGLIALGVGARVLVGSSVALAEAIGVSDLVIALTVIAFGTSAPELFTSVFAALRKQADIAVGNILGSNVFNLLFILGATSAVAPQRVSAQVYWLDAPLMIVLSVALLPIVGTRGRISRSEGGLLVAVYMVYLLVLFAWAPGWFPRP